MHPAPTHSPAQRWQLPTPAVENRLIGGVAAAVGAELGVDPFIVRVAFLLLLVAGGWGALVYLLAWALMQALGTEPDPARNEPKATSDVNRLLGFGLVVMGLLVFFREIGGLFIDSLVWPLALAAAGLAMARERGVELAWGPDANDERPGPARVVPMAGAGLLIVAAVVVAVWLNSDLATARETLIVVAVVIVVALLTGPWVVGLATDLAEERRARIRSDERAQVAAHLHDSVLQTLTLIQRRADDPGVVTLARKQERELRAWLYGRRSTTGPGSFRDRLEQELAEIEDLHEVPIEVVVVGDAPVDDAVAAILAATREAAANAAVHSGAMGVDVFAEVASDSIDVFVRDTGRGFDPSAVPPDRRGLADSIVGRVERAGGRVDVVSSPGDGTEIEMHVDLSSGRGRTREQR